MAASPHSPPNSATPSRRSSSRLAVTATAAVVAFLSAGCAAAPPAVPPSPAPVYDARRHARLLAAADARRADVLLLDSLVTDPHPRVRAAAALAIGQVRARGLVPQLLAATLDADTLVARNAAFALGLLRDSSVVAPLAALASSAPVSVARVAIWSLGEIGAPSQAAIESMLVDTTVRAPEWRREALLAAAKLRPVPSALIARHLATPGPAQWAAAYALSRTRAPGGLRPLLAVRDAEDAEVRAQVARALVPPSAGDSLASESRSALRALASDPHPHVRVNAARSLAAFGMTAEVAKLAEDSIAAVRIAAAQAAVAPASGALPRIYFERLYTADTGWTFRRSVVESAFRAGLRLAAVTDWLRNPDWQRRAAAARAMGAARVPLSLDELDPLTRDPEGRVRAATYEALATWADSGDAAPRVRTMLLVALRDADPYARAAAIGALAGSPRAVEGQLVLESYRLSQRDSVSDARVAALRYVTALAKADTSAVTRGLRDAIATLTPPAGSDERAAVAGSPLFSHWGRPKLADRGADWYAQVVSSLAVSDSQPVAEIVTSRGTLVIELLANEAPLTVENFVSLARRRYYDGLRFHRVVPNFVVQDGDPRGDGNGGPGYVIRDELNPVRYDRGVVGMALSGPDTGGSQYFITHSPQPHLDGRYTAFGRVISGLDVLDSIVQGDQVIRVTIR